MVKKEVLLFDEKRFLAVLALAIAMILSLYIDEYWHKWVDVAILIFLLITGSESGKIKEVEEVDNNNRRSSSKDRVGRSKKARLE